jgi:hypothetical protein
VGRAAVIDVAPLERTELQARLDNAIVQMIRAHRGKPCPTRRDIMEWTGIPRRMVWVVLGEMQARGLIDVQVCASLPALRRRMRVVGDKRGTDWTARRQAPVRTA